MKNILFIISLLISYNIFSQTFNTETYYGDELCQTAQNALISKSSFGLEAFEERIKLDHIKHEYCINNKIRFEIIRYDEDVIDRLIEILAS
tara:strand:- start:1661 stop:1933 length:273 start_codon:yes stop_codon:yes gene_type:complete